MVQVIQFLPHETYPVFRALLIATIYQATDICHQMKSAFSKTLILLNNNYGKEKQTNKQTSKSATSKSSSSKEAAMSFCSARASSSSSSGSLTLTSPATSTPFSKELEAAIYFSIVRASFSSSLASPATSTSKCSSASLFSSVPVHNNKNIFIHKLRPSLTQ